MTRIGSVLAFHLLTCTSRSSCLASSIALSDRSCGLLLAHQEAPRVLHQADSAAVHRSHPIHGASLCGSVLAVLLLVSPSSHRILLASQEWQQVVSCGCVDLLPPPMFRTGGRRQSTFSSSATATRLSSSPPSSTSSSSISATLKKNTQRSSNTSNSIIGSGHWEVGGTDRAGPTSSSS